MKNKKIKNAVSMDEFIDKELQNFEFQKVYLNGSLNDYIETGDFTAFYKSLERVIKAQDSISEFCRKAKIDRTNLYAIFKGEVIPNLETLRKILNQLGCTLNVA